MFRFDRLIVIEFAPCGISPSVCICRKSFSGSVRIASNRPSLSDVSYTHPVSSGISSSSSSSFSLSSESVSVRFLFCTIRSFPLSISRRIASHFPYLPSSPSASDSSLGLFLLILLFRSLFGVFFALKQGLRNFSMYYFSRISFYGIFSPAYSGLYF